MSRRLPALVLAASLAVLLVHAVSYWFVCDDAYISFRYAHNLAQGHGLVFNPGHERVEGYTNFLWVLVLAALDKVGARPESAAPALGLLLTVALWAIVARGSWRAIAPWAPWPFAVFPVVAMALTRSVAVWSTSGLETRLFEVLVAAGVFRLVEETENGRLRPLTALLFALASLTRPDGLLISAASLGAAGGWLLLRRRLRWSEALLSGGTFVAVVGAHFVFRFLYYGAWLPNTYYAKVGGRTWWDMGGAYLASFAVEYAVVLWLLPLVLGVRAFVKDGRASLPILFAAAVLPHALYVASIGGDHFEYRPLDLYFPFAFILVARGLATFRYRALSAAYSSVLVAGLVALPWASHVQFPHEWRIGYPGRAKARADAEGFLTWPGARLHRRLLDTTTASLVGVRQEEHALFVQSVLAQGESLRSLVDRALIPTDTHIAIGAVGAIPYVSALRTLDRLGLTDAVVAHQAPAASRVMAHERHATLEYAAQAGVDLWSVHPFFLVLPLDDDELLWHVETALAEGDEPFVAEVGPDEAIVALLPAGPGAAEARFPRLGLRSVADPAARAAFLPKVVESCRRRLVREPDSKPARIALAMALKAQGSEDEALSVFRELAALDDEAGWYNVGTILAQRGDYEGAIEALERAVLLDPTMVQARHNLGMALARTRQFGPALVQLREAVRLEPESPGALYALGVVAFSAGDRVEAERCRARLEALGTPEATAMARRLSGAL